MDHIERKSKILYGYDEMTIITKFNAIRVVEKLLMQTIDRVKISFTIETLENVSKKVSKGDSLEYTHTM